MHEWLESCEDWLTIQYKNILGFDFKNDPVRLRWLTQDSLIMESEKADAQSMIIEDADVGWLLYLIPFNSDFLELQINQALSLRSQLLRESNYTGIQKAGENEDHNSSWRVGLVWLVDENNEDDWHKRIITLRRESGVTEEISFDAVRVSNNNIHESLDNHGLPRLLLNTRALLRQSSEEAEKWLSADSQVLNELQNFSNDFSTTHSRTIAREMEEKAKVFETKEMNRASNAPRNFQRFRVNNFRNLDTLEIAVDNIENSKAEAIVLFGPNGTGKSSFVEALSLAKFETSPLFERFMIDKDINGCNGDLYLKDYLTPLNSTGAEPSFTLGMNDNCEFTLNPNENSKSRFEGVILSQEDSIKFTELPRSELASRVLTGYSSLADHLSGWLSQEEQRAKDTKSFFTRKHGLNSAIKLSSTAYNRLADTLLSEQLQRPSPEFIDWLRFLGRLSGENGKQALSLINEWKSHQDTAIQRLAGTLSKLQEIGATQADIAVVILEKLNEYDMLAIKSETFRQQLEGGITELREQLEDSLLQIETWGTWLSSQSGDQPEVDVDSDSLKADIESLAKEKIDLEIEGKTLRGRLDLLDQTKQYLTNYWDKHHPDICPVCDSNVEDRHGIKVVVTKLQEETDETIRELRTRHIEIQAKQKDLDAKLKATGVTTCPIANEDIARLMNWLTPFIPSDSILKDWLINPQYRQQLKDDLSKMGALPDAPKPYADISLESERLAKDFVTLTKEADRVLEEPQSLGEVKKEFELRMEKILKEHLPATLGKVWEELTMTLTTASWLLPDKPTLKLGHRGKSLSVQVGDRGRHIRYIYNAAERHVLGLAWFFTYYLSKRRYDEAWVLLDDPAHEMDQSSFRELVRLWETLLRLHQRKDIPLTIITALHQEERALDAARATNGKLYILGWQNRQEDTSNQPSVKKTVLLAPGYHPLKPEALFN